MMFPHVCILRYLRYWVGLTKLNQKALLTQGVVGPSRVVVTDFCLFPAGLLFSDPGHVLPVHSTSSCFLGRASVLPNSLLFFHFSFLCAWPNPTVHTSILTSPCVAFFDQNRKLIRWFMRVTFRIKAHVKISICCLKWEDLGALCLPLSI